MANEGKRCYCRCIKDMKMIIGKEESLLFTKSKVYQCTIRCDDATVHFYKVYGDEFALSCSETEFKEHFIMIKNKMIKA